MRPKESSQFALHQITEAIRRYGISDTSTSMIVVRVGDAAFPSASAHELMKDVVIGDIVPFDELKEVTDWAAIKKVSSKL